MNSVKPGKPIEAIRTADLWSMSKVEMKQLIENTVQRAIDKFDSERRTPEAYQLYELHSSISAAWNGLYALGINAAHVGLLYDGPVLTKPFEDAVAAEKMTVETLRSWLRQLRASSVQERPVFT